MTSTDNLDKLSLTLLQRLSTEDARPPTTPGTHLVGGLAKVGADLERFLREVVVVAADLEGRPPQDLLAPTNGPKPPSLNKSMAGPLAHGLKNYFSTRRPPALLRPIIDDLCLSSGSRTLGFIAARNHIVKEGGDPAPGRAASARLRELLVKFRKDAGWK